MKRKARLTLLLLGIVFVIVCRYMPSLAEGYARMVYPPLSAALSAFSSIFPFPLMEVFVIGLILALIIYPIRLHGKVFCEGVFLFCEGVWDK